MPDPLKKVIADKLLALLEANSDFAAEVRPAKLGNQATTGWLKELILRAPADFPRVSLTNGRTTHSGYTQPGATFATEASDDASTSIIERRFEFKLTITGRDEKSSGVDPAEDAAQTAILAAGRRLGLSASGVTKLEKMNADQKTVIEGNFRRLQSIITIPVLTEQVAADVLP